MLNVKYEWENLIFRSMEKDTPRTKERRSVAEKRLNYLNRSPKAHDTEVITIPRYSPDSLVEINLETFRTEAVEKVDFEEVNVTASIESCATYTVESIEERLQD